MADSHKIKNRVIFTFLAVILVMITAVIVLAHNNHHILRPGGGNDGRWKVEFSSIVEGEKTGSATSRIKPYYIGTSVYFHVDFVAPGDSIVYNVQVSNLGNLDAKLEDIVYGANSYGNAIKYEIIGIEEGEKLKAGRSKNFKVKVSYVLHSNVAVEFDDEILIAFYFAQD